MLLTSGVGFDNSKPAVWEASSVALGTVVVLDNVVDRALMELVADEVVMVDNPVDEVLVELVVGEVSTRLVEERLVVIE